MEKTKRWIERVDSFSKFPNTYTVYTQMGAHFSIHCFAAARIWVRRSFECGSYFFSRCFALAPLEYSLSYSLCGFSKH